jgi:hypothetical protein
MVSQEKEWLEKISVRQKQRTALNRALTKLHAATHGLNTTRNPCDCCGFGLWEDEVESRIALSLGKAINQVAKVRGMILDDLEDLEELVE